MVVQSIAAVPTSAHRAADEKRTAVRRRSTQKKLFGEETLEEAMPPRAPGPMARRIGATSHQGHLRRGLMLVELRGRGPAHAACGCPARRVLLAEVLANLLEFPAFGGGSGVPARFRRRNDSKPHPTAATNQCVELGRQGPAGRQLLAFLTTQAATQREVFDCRAELDAHATPQELSDSPAEVWRSDGADRQEALQGLRERVHDAMLLRSLAAIRAARFSTDVAAAGNASSKARFLQVVVPRSPSIFATR
eukprot:CAMPEP_0117515796 /NCGR_PEP_ID=MMETSP0784-20121206/30765_1 /TAXON_ID=39447 /ORGANISM="" /LENGTH=249 /DNA_ID=CAMNT_0005311625 /DNA_START=46 /DNA_END=797 /DNA_ORIENTATION=+